MSRSPVSTVSCVRRSSANFSRTSPSSSLITPRSFVLLARIDSSSLMVAWSSASSSRSFWPSSCVRRRSCMSRMWLAWISVNSNGSAIRPAAGGLDVGGAPDQRDDGVDHVERLHQAFDDVLAVPRLAQPVLGAPADDLHLVGDVDLDRGRQVEEARRAVDQRQHVHREAGLHRRVLVELVQHDLRVGVALELDHEAHGVTRRLVAHVADAFDLAVVHELGDLLADHLDRGLVRHLGDDDALALLRSPRSRRPRAS